MEENETFVYFLLKNSKIVYVGQTTKGLSRIKQHLIDSNKDFDDFKIIKCEESELKELENYYMIKFNPIYNKALNSVNVKYGFIMNELRKRMGFCPYSKKACSDFFNNSNFKKEKFKGQDTMSKNDAKKICDFLETKYYNILAEIKSVK